MPQKKKSQLQEASSDIEKLKAKISVLSSKNLTTPRNLRYHVRTVTDSDAAKYLKTDLNSSGFSTTSTKERKSKRALGTSRLNNSIVNTSVLEDVGQTVKAFFYKNIFRRNVSDNILPPEFLRAQTTTTDTSREY